MVMMARAMAIVSVVLAPALTGARVPDGHSVVSTLCQSLYFQSFHVDAGGLAASDGVEVTFLP